MDFSLWLLAGVAIGMILMAFLAIGTYQRGYDAGFMLRKPWQTELEARRLAVGTAHGRTIALAITPWTADPSPVETRAA